jgi:adenosine kinase
MMKIFVSGSMAYDRIMDFPGRFSDHIFPDKIHILNVCFTVNGMVEKFGGTAGNIAYSLALLGQKPAIIAAIGKDYRRYFDWLAENRIPVDGIRVIEEEFTAGAYITTDQSDNQITGFNPGAMKHMSGYTFEGDGPADSICIIGPGNLRDMKAYAAICKQKGIRVICDPGQSLTQWDGEGLREWLRGAMMLISNDYELEMVQKMTGLDKQGLLGLTGTIITTLGERGSVICGKSGDIPVPPAKAEEVMDPTGAGDAYRGGLLFGIVNGKDLPTSARLGAVAAAYAIEKYGTQEHRFTQEEFMDRYRQNFGGK